MTNVDTLDPFSDVLTFEPDVYSDDRGYFLETWHQERYKDAGITGLFVQENHSRSWQGVLRGLHFQHPRPQGKLIQVLRGEVYDVAVDLRVGSSTYGQWGATRLSDANHRQVWIPEGFAHGFLALSKRADLHYKCTDYYAPEAEHTLHWDDPTVGVQWPLDDPVMSDRDASGESLEVLREADQLFQTG